MLKGIEPKIIGMDNYHDPFKPYIREFTKKDIGKKIRKIVPSRTPTGFPDCSYMYDDYILKNIMTLVHCDKCYIFVQKNKCIKCNGCHKKRYCSNKCKKNDKMEHSIFCKGTITSNKCSKQKIKSSLFVGEISLVNENTSDNYAMIIIDSNGDVCEIDGNFCNGWIVTDEIKHLEPNTIISDNFITKLKEMENDY